MMARAMYKTIPTDLQPLLNSNRLLIISTSNATRQSRATALARNRFICEQADSILFVDVTEHSSLYPLQQEFNPKSTSLSITSTARPTMKSSSLTQRHQ